MIKHQNHLWIFFSPLLGTLEIAFRNVFLFFVFWFWVFLTHSPDESTGDNLGQHLKTNGFEMALPEDLFSLLAFGRSHVAKVKETGTPKEHLPCGSPHVEDKR